VGAGSGGVGVALKVGVGLGGVAVPVVLSVGDAVALPGDGVTDGEAVRLAVGCGLGVSGEGVGDGETVRLAVGDGLGVPEGRASSEAVGVAMLGVEVMVSDDSGLGGARVSNSGLAEEEGSGAGVSEGVASEVGEAEVSTCATAGMPPNPLTDDEKGKFMKKISPTNARALAGPNRGTLTPSP
jgi:hypothetical protein